MMNTADTLQNMNLVGDEIINLNLDIATAPMSIWGAKGERFAILMKRRGKESIKEAKDLAKMTVSHGLKMTGMEANRTLKSASEVTVVGIEAVKNGVEMGEYVVLVAGDRIEKIIKVPRNVIERGKDRMNLFKSDDQGSK
jgi:hypothetical protein